MTIITQAAGNTVVVPNTALSYSGSQSVVDVLRNGVVTPVQVQVGITDGVNTQIVAGLQAGDQVVTGSSRSASTSKAAASKTTSILASATGPSPGLAP